MNASSYAALQARREAGVPVEPFQEAFKRSGMTASELARRMGWTRERRHRWKNGKRYVRRAPYVQADATRAMRYLGLSENWCSRRQRHVRTEFMKYETALRFAEALDLDPVDVGL